ncbi:vesicle transport protein SFT2B, putative [Entamoeba invadens IP1]|uniref:Vesicle transport protein n=1 Tax=Entamoeba invadens IP1 TaxID=370355 RepID=A0A0A1TUM8_ENTIV|nr:vesicle transport protein SFT2B, putative [Entamoeba invadens IP1]ELP83759.1 vesicle transport protein SFT2B, putative [Entamoeba invadens IP1]|eukprot:XP_004183105.1 vesicle transport protein SFT2B, putative [Entamoeba invadens IP1]
MFTDTTPLISGATSFFITKSDDPDSSSWFDRLFEDEDKGMFSCLQLTWTQRMLCCVIFCGLGFLSLFISLSFFIFPTKFALIFTFGNVLLFVGTSFLRSVKAQIVSIFNDPAKLVAVIIYFVSIGLTLFSSLYLNSTILTLLSVIIEICSCVWYVASYIPYAQTCLSSAFKSCFKKSTD